MPHVFEPAPSARAKCRGCGQPIGKGEVRFGERLANPFGDGEATLWFHPACAAWRRPEPLLEALAAATVAVPERDELERTAQFANAHRRVPRIDGAERAPSGRASCRHCKAVIEKGSWRIRLVYFEDGRLSPGGSVHLGCRREYFETGDVLAPLLHFSPGLAEPDRAELTRACAEDRPAPPA